MVGEKVTKDAPSSVKSCCTSPSPVNSMYKRPLPSPAISLYSEEGRRLFDESRALGTAAGFLEISTNLVTQKKLTYCGLSSLITILNALLIDPQLVWKGSWRWYDEDMLVNDQIREKVELQGLSFQELMGLVPKDKTGKGHYSPIGAYNPRADVVLLLDVARFKYPPHWVPMAKLWEAMAAQTSPTSGETRGFMVISKL